MVKYFLNKNIDRDSLEEKIATFISPAYYNDGKILRYRLILLTLVLTRHAECTYDFILKINGCKPWVYAI